MLASFTSEDFTAFHCPSQSTDATDLHESHLFPITFPSIDWAIFNFTTVFEHRYGDRHPPFFVGSIDEAVSTAAQLQRPLAIYLNHDHAVAHHIFAQKVMCDQSVRNFLEENFVTFPWDFTLRQHRNLLLDTEIGKKISAIISCHSGWDSFPMLIAITCDGKTAATIASGTNGAEIAYENLKLFIQQEETCSSDLNLN